MGKLYLGNDLVYPYLGNDYLFYNPPLEVVSNGLQLYVDASQYTSGTTWSDLSGNGNDATLNGSPSHTSGTSAYFQLDGNNDYVRLPIGLSTTAHTIQMIVMKLGGKTSDQMFSCVATGNTTSNTPYRGGEWTTSDVESYAYTASPEREALITNYSVNVYYDVVITQSSGTQQGYVNNSQTITNRTSMPSLGQNDEIVVGTGFLGYASMRVAVILVYDRELSSAEVSQNYNVFSNRY